MNRQVGFVWFCFLVALLMVWQLHSFTSVPDPSNQTVEKLAQHYAALLSPYIETQEKQPINHILSTLMLEQAVVSASAYLENGERVASNGSAGTVADLVKSTDPLSSVFVPIFHDQAVIGYLSILYRPNNA